MVGEKDNPGVRVLVAPLTPLHLLRQADWQECFSLLSKQARFSYQPTFISWVAGLAPVLQQEVTLKLLTTGANHRVEVSRSQGLGHGQPSGGWSPSIPYSTPVLST